MSSTLDPANIHLVIAEAEALRLETTASTGPGGTDLFRRKEYLPFDEDLNDQTDTHQETAPVSSPEYLSGATVPGSSATSDPSNAMSVWDGHPVGDSGSEITHLTLESVTPVLTDPYVLHCDFYGLEHCNSTFPVNQKRRWMDHVMGHFRGNFPPLALCSFCDQAFAAASPSPDHCRETFRARLEHIAAHIRQREYGIDDVRPDYAMVRHLGDHGLIASETHAAGLRWVEGPKRPSFMPADWEPSQQAAQLARAQFMPYDLDKEERQRKREEREKGKGKGKGRADDRSSRRRG